MSEVVLVMGYPAAGKSTMAEEHVKKGYVYLNRDTKGGTVSNLVPLMIDAIRKGQNVVLDNTFPTAEIRAPFIAAAQLHDADIFCDWLDAPIEEAQFNACMRMIDREGKILSPAEMKTTKSPNLFPPVVLFKYKKDFVKPTVSEGFGYVVHRGFNRIFPDDWINKALFLDYDGTLRITKSGAKWPSDPDDIEILPNRRAWLDSYVAAGYKLLGVSNQSGIAKGSPTEEEAIACFEKTNELLGHEIPYFYCPHRVPPVSCYCRKPMPGMAVYFFHKYKIDPRKSIMVGDMTSDKTFAKRSHMKFIHADEFFEAGVKV